MSSILCFPIARAIYTEWGAFFIVSFMLPPSVFFFSFLFSFLTTSCCLSARPPSFDQLREFFREPSLKNLSEYDFVNMSAKEAIAAMDNVQDVDAQAQLLIRYCEFNKPGKQTK